MAECHNVDLMKQWKRISPAPVLIKVSQIKPVKFRCGKSSLLKFIIGTDDDVCIQSVFIVRFDLDSRHKGTDQKERVFI